MKSLRRPHPASVRGGKRRYTTRRGTAAIWGLASMGLLLAIASLVVDGALLYGSQGDLQAAADSAALAGASGLTTGPDEARRRAVEYGEKNIAAGDLVDIRDEDVVLGDWDHDAQTFTPVDPGDEDSANAVRVTAKLNRARGNGLGLAFAQVFGDGEADVQAEATAIYRPRDIVLVLDLSGSMSDDSEIRSIGSLGRDAIESQLELMWNELGAPQYGNMTFQPRYISTNDRGDIKQALGLNNVPYPYPSGSWNSYIDYVRGNSTLDRYGYRKKYGGLTLMNYWLEYKSRHNQTPDLWMTSHQPLTAVKDAVDVFVDFLREEATEDRLALAVYTASDGTGLLEHGLTDDFTLIQTIARQRQAGHYSSPTNIGAGMEVARQELMSHGRPGTLKTMVLLTDGQANRPNNSSDARAYVIDEAYAAAAARIPIATISLGANADTNLMQQVADIAGGVHFNVPGGAAVADYEDPLKEVFRHIAAERPLRLVR